MRIEVAGGGVVGVEIVGGGIVEIEIIGLGMEIVVDGLGIAGRMTFR